jgi:hypothetical protein
MRKLGGGCCAACLLTLLVPTGAVMSSQSSNLGNANQFGPAHINAADLNIHEPPLPRPLN